VTPDLMILGQEWRTFRLTGPDGAHLFYRCPLCGAALDWRDQDLHLGWHGVTNSVIRAEIITRQEYYAEVRK
jgi:hypothetical protein